MGVWIIMNEKTYITVEEVEARVELLCHTKMSHMEVSLIKKMMDVSKS